MLRRAFDRRRGRITVEGLHHALLHEHDRNQDRQRQQDVERAARKIGPKIPDAVRLLAHKPTRQRDGDRDAGRSAHEIVHRQTGHLREVTHCRFAGIRLPVRIRHEADRGVEREGEGNVRQVLRIERQPLLRHFHDQQHDAADDVEHEHRDRVGLPRHLLRRRDAGKFVDAPLNRPEWARQKMALSRKHPRQEFPERRGDGDQSGDEKRQLKEIAFVHMQNVRPSGGGR